MTIGNSVTSINDSAFAGCDHIMEMTCKATVSPTVAEVEAFGDVYKGIPLYVPEVSICNYHVAYGWRDFYNILPIANEGIGEAHGANAMVYSHNGRLVVEGADDNSVTLYNAAGRILATKHSANQTITFDIPVTGAYLVKIGSAPARRVVVVR